MGGEAAGLALSVIATESVAADLAEPGGALAGCDLMSPYVWEKNGEYELLLRVVRRPLRPDDATGVIYSGHCPVGLDFKIDPKPAIVPGPDFVDAGGVEDPTVIYSTDDTLLVFFTGVDGAREQGSLLVAKGADLTSLRKERVMLQAPAGEGNIKEATVARGADGRFRMFYEYAKDRASRIGMAVGDGPDGPWVVADDPFTVREQSWDRWHLSTGPIVARPGRPPVMFYNGATIDAHWRIGWIAFDPAFTRVVARCEEPLLMPPPPDCADCTDIAFAASCIDDGETIRLYYSVEDRLLRRASIRMSRGRGERPSALLCKIRVA